MSTEFKWDDEKVLEFVRFTLDQSSTFQGRYTDLKQFKESKQPKPEWEIIQVSSPECGLYYLDGYKMRPNDKIYSVKRLSDGEIFNIGDEVTYLPVQNSSWIINNFFIRDDNKMLARSKDNIYCEYVDNNLSKSKIPLFTTLDLKPIFKGERFYYVDKSFNIKDYWADSAWTPREDGLEFSTKEAAEEYILWNKPCLSLSEVVTRYNCVGGKDREFIEAMKQLAKIKLDK